jgi:hypothetical protein
LSKKLKTEKKQKRRKTMRYVIAVFLSIIVMGLAVSAYSHRGTNVDIRIVSDNGTEFFTIPFKESKKGNTRVIKKYLEAKREGNYSIIARNDTAERIGIVIAVDGRNIINGKKSFLRNNESMYIVPPYGETRLDGWRTDKNSVHKFYFTDKGDSYAVKTFSDTSAMGVISVAVFHEKKRPNFSYKRPFPGEDARSAPAAPGKEGRLKSFESDSAGTGFGDRKYSPAVNVQFEPESTPAEKILVKYEWRDVLCRKGLLKCWKEEKNRLWDEYEFAPYPPDYIK